MENGRGVGRLGVGSLALLLSPLARAEFIAYVSTLVEDSIIRLVDFDGDGAFNSADETAVFFGPGNASGFPGVGSAQALLVLGCDDLLAADGERCCGFTKRVYRLRDLNGDGDAMDAGEATEHWDGLLPGYGGANFDRPKDMVLAGDAVYLADNNTINLDGDSPEAVWRLEDLNGDGDVNDPGEATLLIELAPPGDAFAFVTEDFKWGDAGRLFFSNVPSSTNSGSVWIIEPDLSLTRYASEADFVGLAFAEVGMTLHPETGAPVMAAVDFLSNRRIVELLDLDGNGSSDGNSEQRTRYRSDTSATGITWDPNNAMDVEFAPDGSLWLLDNTAKTIVRFGDLTGDGDYQDADEARIIYHGAAAAANGGIAMQFLRTVAFFAPPATAAPADLDGDGLVGSADLAILLGAWGLCAGPEECVADIDGDGVVGSADLAALLGAWG